jgi:hypothetical protein
MDPKNINRINVNMEYVRRLGIDPVIVKYRKEQKRIRSKL